MSSPRRRERHGRGLRSGLFGAQVPARRTRAHEFDAAAGLLMEQVRENAAGELDTVALATDLTPPASATAVELGRVYPAAPGRPATLLLCRMPILRRAEDREELIEVLADVIAEQAALLCGRSADELRPRL
ncbi:hypothetical protein GSY69_12825 [Brevibacterium sp. 5221]|uniref:Peptidase n=1 Tax=Brevibacterium rongguiense TaxID=2695267 RepID=A0A6N9HAR5_9MICO|nr:hypothetical protein [Brevibacterium rongguiense]MYM20821.1 hypothetical protein [Brevibacterium rongguiense]